MNEQDSNPQQYSQSYFSKPFPPNHNPLIGSVSMDTIANVHNTLCTLRQLTEGKDYESEESELTGLFFLMTCIIHALAFELENRQQN